MNCWNRLFAGAAIVISILLCCSAAAFFFGMLPPSEIIAQRYLDAVIRDDVKSAIYLAAVESLQETDNQKAVAHWAFVKELCQKSVQADFERDVTQFGKSEIRNVSIVVTGGRGSSDTVQFANVQFEYRKSASGTWQRGEMRLMTDTPYLGFRYLCGNLKYHGP